MAKTEMNVSIRVRLAPRIASTRKKGAKRTIELVKDRHEMTHTTNRGQYGCRIGLPDRHVRK